MVTITTSCLRAILTPSYQADDPDPLAKPPPCIQNMTGRLPLDEGVQTLRTRQSSPAGGGVPPPAMGLG